MTLSTALALNGHSGQDPTQTQALVEGQGPGLDPAEALANGYGPEGVHPLMVSRDSRPGAYDAYYSMVRSTMDREMRTLGNYIQSGYYPDPRLRNLVSRYYQLALWQVTSPAGLLNHRRTELVRERTNLHEVLQGLKCPLDPEDVRAMEADEAEKLYRTSLTYGSDTLARFQGTPWLVPLTLRDCYDRLNEITALVRGLSAQIQQAQRKGTYWDCGPLIDYFTTPYTKRGEIDLMAIAPPFLLKLQPYIDVSIADVWREHAQRIISQSNADGAASMGVAGGEAEGGKKRGLLGRVMKR